MLPEKKSIKKQRNNRVESRWLSQHKNIPNQNWAKKKNNNSNDEIEIEMTNTNTKNNNQMKCSIKAIRNEKNERWNHIE